MLCRHSAANRLLERSNEMSRNALYLVIAILAAGIATVGFMYYQGTRDHLDIQIGEHGVKIQGN